MFLPLDLISGRVAPGHELWVWLLAQGASVPELESFLVDPVALDVIGINLYPMFSNKELISDKSSRQRMRMVSGMVLCSPSSSANIMIVMACR